MSIPPLASVMLVDSQTSSFHQLRSVVSGRFVVPAQLPLVVPPGAAGVGPFTIVGWRSATWACVLPPSLPLPLPLPLLPPPPVISKLIVMGNAVEVLLFVLLS